MAALWGLQTAQPGHQTGPVPATTHGGPVHQAGGDEGLHHHHLRKGYWQIPVEAKDVQKTAVITPFGLWEFLRMPFGLKNAGQTFQRFVDNILASIPHVFVYMDDILVASPTVAEHKKDVQQVMEVLEQHGLVINREKC